MNFENKVKHGRGRGAGVRRLCFSILVCLFMTWLSVSCARKELAPLRVGSEAWVGYEPFYIARHLGYLDEAQVRLAEFTSTSEIIRAFTNGTLDASMVTLDEALLLAQDVRDTRLVLVLDISNGGDVILAKPGIASLKDLKGRRVGADTSALGAYVLMRALQLAELNPQDVEIVPLDDADHESAFRQGRVDAVVTFEPMSTQLRNLGARQIFDSTQIPGEIVDVLVVRDTYLHAHPDTIKHLIQGYYRGRKYLKEQPQEAAKIAAPRMKITPEEFLSSLKLLRLPQEDESVRMLIGSPPALLKNARAMNAMMREKGLLNKTVDVDALFDQRALSALMP